LKKITDMGGLSSAFSYESGYGGFISQMTTPYGTSTFASTESRPGDEFSRQLILTDPNGHSEKVLFSQSMQPPADPYIPAASSLAWNPNFSIYRNTFYWDKKGMALDGNDPDGNDPANATIYHWLHDTDNGAWLTSEILESLKPPLQSRIWFLYPGQSVAIYSGGITNKNPSVIARLVDDPSHPNDPSYMQTQMYQIEYNDRGKPTSIMDPPGRKTTFTYDNNHLDLLTVRQTTGSYSYDLLAEYSGYDSHHRPTYFTDAARQTYTLSWNSFGQLTQISNPKSEVTRLNYFADVPTDDPRYGQLQNIEQLWSGGTKTTAFDYDNYRRVHSVTDSENYTLTYDYDDLDRLTKVTYPDLTFEQYEYARLDLVRARDRTGNATEMTYDGVGQPLTVKDRLGRVTTYSWCGCGGLESVTDPLNQTTSWVYDVAGRVTAKFYADAPNTPGLQYAYATYSGKLKTITDRKSQTKSYSYNADGTLAGVSYSEGSATPSVSFTYDPNYRRLYQMNDGTGTTTFNYKPVTSPGTMGAGRLASVAGPLATVAYAYDELGRVVGRSIDNATAETVGFDDLGRVISNVNELGTWTPSYVNATRRLSSLTYPNGQVTTYDYFGNSVDQRLSRIWNKFGGDTLSKFEYQYDVLGRITQWTRQLGVDGTTPEVMALAYDREDQLLGAVVAPQGQAASKAYDYGYDPAGNRTGEEMGTTGVNRAFAVTVSTYNSVNQLLGRGGSGALPIKFRGTVNEPATVTVGGDPATMQQDPNSASNGKIFSKTLNLPPGNNSIQVVATDFGVPPHTTTRNYTVNVVGGDPRSYSYDSNGNCSGYNTASDSWSYEYDAEDRLVAVELNYGETRSEFTYDGFGRRVKIVEKEYDTTTSTKQFVWDRMTICEERDAYNAVTKRFYAEGQVNYQPSTLNLYYTRDHLASVREVRGSAGMVRARYNYDPYGRVTKVSGTQDVDFLYTGLYYHSPSGLHLALFRAYDADTGRWLNRDPIGEAGGLNLYGYVGNNPIGNVDPFGLWGIAFGNDSGSSYFNIGWGDPTLYFSPDSINDLGQGAAAAGDGLLDAATMGGGFGLFDPGIFGRSGAYDPCDPTLRTSRRLGEFAGSLLDAAGALRGAAKVGGTELGYTLNHNRYLRIGPGNIPRPTEAWQSWLTRGPGQNVPTLRIGTGRPQWWNHWDLRAWGY
jgi:RHS repeat-associated protein